MASPPAQEAWTDDPPGFAVPRLEVDPPPPEAYERGLGVVSVAGSRQLDHRIVPVRHGTAAGYLPEVHAQVVAADPLSPEPRAGAEPLSGHVLSCHGAGLVFLPYDAGPRLGRLVLATAPFGESSEPRPLSFLEASIWDEKGVALLDLTEVVRSTPQALVLPFVATVAARAVPLGRGSRLLKPGRAARAWIALEDRDGGRRAVLLTSAEPAYADPAFLAIRRFEADLRALQARSREAVTAAVWAAALARAGASDPHELSGPERAEVEAAAEDRWLLWRVEQGMDGETLFGCSDRELAQAFAELRDQMPAYRRIPAVRRLLEAHAAGLGGAVEAEQTVPESPAPEEPAAESPAPEQPAPEQPVAVDLAPEEPAGAGEGWRGEALELVVTPTRFDRQQAVEALVAHGCARSTAERLVDEVVPHRDAVRRCADPVSGPSVERAAAAMVGLDVPGLTPDVARRIATQLVPKRGLRAGALGLALAVAATVVFHAVVGFARDRSWDLRPAARDGGSSGGYDPSWLLHWAEHLLYGAAWLLRGAAILFALVATAVLVADVRQWLAVRRRGARGAAGAPTTGR